MDEKKNLETWKWNTTCKVFMLKKERKEKNVIINIFAHTSATLTNDPLNREWRESSLSRISLSCCCSSSAISLNKPLASLDLFSCDDIWNCNKNLKRTKKVRWIYRIKFDKSIAYPRIWIIYSSNLFWVLTPEYKMKISRNNKLSCLRSATGPDK